jgi:hypothetical protein
LQAASKSRKECLRLDYFKRHRSAMTELKEKKAEPFLEEADVREVIEKSRRTVERTKLLVLDLETDIRRQEKLLARQREDLKELLDELGIERI